MAEDIKKNSLEDVEENLIYLAKFVTYAGIGSAILCAFTIIRKPIIVEGIVITAYVLFSSLIGANLLKVLAKMSLSLKILSDKVEDKSATKPIAKPTTKPVVKPVAKSSVSSVKVESDIILYSWIKEIKTGDEYQVVEIYDDGSLLCANAKNTDGKKLKRSDIEPIK